MKQMNIVHSVALSLLCLIGTMDAKSSIPSSDSPYQAIIGAVCIGGLCIMGVGAIFYIGRLEKRIEEQSRRIDIQDKCIAKQTLIIKHQSEAIVGQRMENIKTNESLNVHCGRLTALEQWQKVSRKQQKRYARRVISLEQWQDKMLGREQYYSFSSSCSTDSE